MGVSRKRLDPHTMDPVSAQRLASGVWHHRVEQSFEHGYPIEEWMLDVPAVEHRLGHMLRNARAIEMQEWLDNPEAFVDARFGQGTMKALQIHKQNPRTPYRERRHMALHYDPAAWKYFTGTTSTSNTTTIYTNSHAAVREDINRAVKKKLNESVSFKPKLPAISIFQLHGRTLLDALQKDFNSYADRCRRDLFAA